MTCCCSPRPSRQSSCASSRSTLPDYVLRLWDGMSLLAKRRFDLGDVPAGVLRADPDRLAQALRNLIGNAIEHTLDGEGLVRMRIGTLANGWVGFAVEDDGPGIDPGQREHVFDRFHRTDIARDRASGGTGLGSCDRASHSRGTRGTCHRRGLC